MLGTLLHVLRGSQNDQRSQLELRLRLTVF